MPTFDILALSVTCPTVQFKSTLTDRSRRAKFSKIHFGTCRGVPKLFDYPGCPLPGNYSTRTSGTFITGATGGTARTAASAAVDLRIVKPPRSVVSTSNGP